MCVLALKDVVFFIHGLMVVAFKMWHQQDSDQVLTEKVSVVETRYTTYG